LSRLYPFITPNPKSVLAVLVVLLVTWPQPLSWLYLNLGSIEANRYLVGQESAIALRAAEENLTAAVGMGVSRSYRQLGRLQLQRGDFTSASQSLEHWVVLNPGDALGHWILGHSYEAEGNREAAIAEWKKAEAFHYLMRLGDEEGERGRWYQAIDLFQAATEVAAERSNRVLAQRWDYVVERGWEAHQRLGSALWRGLGDMEGGLRQYEWAVILSPWNLNLYTDIAALYERSGDWDAAARWLERALPVDPGNADLLMLLALNRIKADDPANAIRWARQALKEDPKRSVVWVALGQALIAREDYMAAAEALEQAISIAGPSPELYAWLGAAWRLQEQIDRAKQAYLAGLSLRPDDLNLLRSLAVIVLKQGLTNEAISYLEMATKEHPENIDAHLELAGAYYEAGRMDDARQQYRLVLTIDSNEERAKQGLSALEQ
jgi:tetratricopeptide (TPR) repeat protein